MRSLHRRRTFAVLGTMAMLSPVAAALPADAAPNPGQDVVNDYGQTDAEVSAEVAAAVNADRAVVAARARVGAAHALTVTRTAAEARAKKAYAKARASKKRKPIARSRKAYRHAHARTVAARATEASARTACARQVAITTSDVRQMHYRPVDGEWDGPVTKYFIPPDLEPIRVHITVTGGHVSAVTVPVFQAAGESGRYNARALPLLIEAALAAHDTVNVATVSGATLTSGAFRSSLYSALVLAGFPG